MRFRWTMYRDNRKIEHRPKKNPKLQTNLICIFEKKEQTIEGIPVYHECTQKLKEKRSSENVVS